MVCDKFPRTYLLSEYSRNFAINPHSRCFIVIYCQYIVGNEKIPDELVFSESSENMLSVFSQDNQNPDIQFAYRYDITKFRRSSIGKSLLISISLRSKSLFLPQLYLRIIFFWKAILNITRGQAMSFEGSRCVIKRKEGSRCRVLKGFSCPHISIFLSTPLLFSFSTSPSKRRSPLAQRRKGLCNWLVRFVSPICLLISADTWFCWGASPV